MNRYLYKHEIQDSVEENKIDINPWRESQLRNFSYDLTLNPKISLFKNLTNNDFNCDPFDTSTGKTGTPGERLKLLDKQAPLDLLNYQEIISYEMDDRGFLFKPGIGYILKIEEIVTSKNYEMTYEFSYLEKNFCNTIYHDIKTGELYFSCLHNVILYPGSFISSVSFVFT